METLEARMNLKAEPLEEDYNSDDDQTFKIRDVVV
jgi:hypothetical protein